MRALAALAQLVTLFATLAALWPSCWAASKPSKWIPSYAGPFIAYMDRIYACQVPKKENVMDVHLRPSHFRNQALAQTTLQTIDGNFTMKAPVDDSWGGHVKMDVWNNNQWKENSLVFPFKSGYCSVVRANWPGMYSSFWKKDPYIKEPCVMPKNEYIMGAVTVNWTAPNFPALPYGRYRTVTTIFPPKKDVTCCFTMEMFVIPKLARS